MANQIIGWRIKLSWLNPRPPMNCPISSVEGGLPAMPFIAAINAAGDCVGLKPQMITGLK